MKNINLIALTALGMILIQGATAKAETNLTIVCKVETFGERTDDVVQEKISFDADKGYKTLKFVADGQALTASIVSSTNFEKNISEDKIVSLCITTKRATSCTESDLTVYGDNAYQPGNYTTVSCHTEGDNSRSVK